MLFDAKLLRRTAVAKHDDYCIADIARRLDIPYGTVVRWTSGRSVPAARALAAIEHAYGLTAGDLFPADA